MSKILLRSNRRFGTLGLLFVLTLSVVVGLVALFGGQVSLQITALAVLTGLMFVGWQLWQFVRTPRVLIEGDELLLYVGSLRAPFRVPLRVVEVFFMGQGAVSGEEPGHPRDYQGHVAANVVVRLAESAPEWHCRRVNEWLAVWDDGYVTLRGLWCENIDQDLLKSMNSGLMQAKRALREKGER